MSQATDCVMCRLCVRLPRSLYAPLLLPLCGAVCWVSSTAGHLSVSAFVSVCRSAAPWKQAEVSHIELSSLAKVHLYYLARPSSVTQRSFISDILLLSLLPNLIFCASSHAIDSSFLARVLCHPLFPAPFPALVFPCPKDCHRFVTIQLLDSAMH